MDPRIDPAAARRLVAIRLIHTVVWAFFAACVLAIPVAAGTGHMRLAGVLIAVVAGEVAVLALNAWRCPLTEVAARYTDDRAADFDIYLPLWLARYNKEVFGTLYVLGIAYTVLRSIGAA